MTDLSAEDITILTQDNDKDDYNALVEDINTVITNPRSG